MAKKNPKQNPPKPIILKMSIDFSRDKDSQNGIEMALTGRYPT